MKALKKTYTVKIGEAAWDESLYELVIDLTSNQKSYTTEVPKVIDGNCQWVTVPIECPHMIKNIDTLVQNDTRVICIEVAFDEGSSVIHSRINDTSRVLICNEKYGEYLFHILNRKKPNPVSECYGNEIAWSLCWDHFPSHWIDEHGVLEQI